MMALPQTPHPTILSTRDYPMTRLSLKKTMVKSTLVTLKWTATLSSPLNLGMVAPVPQASLLNLWLHLAHFLTGRQRLFINSGVTPLFTLHVTTLVEALARSWTHVTA
jgi:hypothetical protein